MPQPGESRTTPGAGITPEQELWAQVLRQALHDSVAARPGATVERERARAFLARLGPDLRTLLGIMGVDADEQWPRILPVLREAWQLCDSLIEARAGGPGRGSHEPGRILKAVVLAREAEREQRRRERLEEARRGWRQALERCGYSSDPGGGCYLGASEAPRAS